MYYIIAEDGNCACDIKPRLQEPCAPEKNKLYKQPILIEKPF